MRVTSLGYASLYIEIGDHRILIDPVFPQTILNGVVRCNPERRLDLERLPAPTAVVITAPDFLHFHAPTLEQISRVVPVYHAENGMIRRGLETLRFSRVHGCTTWQQIDLDGIHLIATPSAREDGKIGVAIVGRTNFWSMGDSEPTPDDGERLAQRYGPIDVVAVKYQPFERSAVSYASGGAARPHKRVVANWLEAACAARPAFVFPHDPGFIFENDLAWLNTYVFPFSAEAIAELLRRRLGNKHAEVLNPGDSVHCETGSTPTRMRQASDYVRMTASQVHHWQPVDSSTVTGLADPRNQAELEETFDTVAENLASWFEDELRNPSSAWRQYRVHGVVWQLVIEAGGSNRIERFIDCGKTAAVRHGRHPRANSFTHVSGKALFELLCGRWPASIIHAAAQTRNYDNVIGLAGGRLVAPRLGVESSGEVMDPLAYYLGHFDPSDMRATIPPAKRTLVVEDPSEMEVLSRQGATKPVLMKKVLLSILALEESSRLGLPITDADVQTVMGWFRDSFGFENEKQMQDALHAAGLDMNSFRRVMSGFAAVAHAQARHSSEIESLMDNHQKVATISKVAQ